MRIMEILEVEKEGEKDLIEKTVKRRNITSERTRTEFFQ